jgi:hypothetical protein
MDADVLSNREVTEHVKLLRRAASTRLILLGFLVVATWGLWAALQAGDQRTAPVDKIYGERLAELKNKWSIPADSPFGLNSDDIEVTNLLVKEKNDRFKNVLQIVQFESELDALRNEYYADLERAYIIHVKIPYLQESVEVNGVTLADWWPFGLIAIGAAALVLGMRERINAIVVAWAAYNRKENPGKSDLIIQSDFLIGTLSKGRRSGEQYLVYRKPVTLQPESLILFALIGATAYMSLSFGFFQNPANSHEMESMLDYSGAIWFCLVSLGILVWLTRKRYAERLEQFTGIPIRGRINESLHRIISSDRLRKLESIRWLRKLASMSEALFAVAALLCLCFPWMNPKGIAGYRFFLSDSPAPLDSDLYFELQVQLYIAILFIVLCLVDWIASTRLHEKWYGLLPRARRILGFATAVLLGNVIFHFILLQTAVMAQSEQFLLLLPVNLLARPHPVKNSSLAWTEPSYGFWLFLIFCLALVMVGKRPPVNHSETEN